MYSDVLIKKIVELLVVEGYVCGAEIVSENFHVEGLERHCKLPLEFSNFILS